VTNRKLEPRASDPSYLMLRSLAVEIRATLRRRLDGREGLDVIDVGCGTSPYEPLLRPYAGRYVGVDLVPLDGVDVVAPAESLPFPDATFDCLICSQVLYAVEDPAVAVREFRRVLRPGGIALVSTHGVKPYYPHPYDYWRWTHAGLVRLFSGAGSWRTIEVYPNGGNATALGYLFALELGAALKKARARALAPPLTFLVNLLAWNLDRGYRRLFPHRPPDLVANYLVVAAR
jgi:SAM-dependent methyltransferase